MGFRSRYDSPNGQISVTPTSSQKAPLSAILIGYCSLSYVKHAEKGEFTLFLSVLVLLSYRKIPMTFAGICNMSRTSPRCHCVLTRLIALMLVLLTMTAYASEQDASQLVFVPPPLAPPLQLSVVNANADSLHSATRFHTLWDKIGHQIWIYFDPDRPRVAAQRKRYVDNKGYLLMVTERAEPFLYHIVQQLSRENMPLELAVLPIIESAYMEDATSKHGAAGLWQFIPSTGKKFGLQHNWWYEGRRDLIASTHAAIRYLKELNHQFDGDWLLTLAAYNAGENNVHRAIARNKARGKPTDFWHLQLPKETMAYVPRFLAVVSIIQIPEYYGIELWPISDKPYFTELETAGKTSLRKIAKQYAVNYQTLQRLNAGLRRQVTPPKNAYAVLLPLETIALTDAASLQIAMSDSTQPTAGYTQHKVRSGETLTRISKRYGVSIPQIKSTNQLSNDHIRAGQTLMIPES